MKKLKLHPEEEKRIASLKFLNILDSVPEKEFDEITHLASLICQTPIALISLIDTDRQWFKSKLGLNAAETPRDIAFCSHAILQEDIFIVSDASQDDQFCNYPSVTGELQVMFYAGVPLLDPISQLPIGTLCVIDHKARTLTDQQIEALKILTRQTEQLLKLRVQNFELAQTKQHFEESQKIAKIGVWEIDLVNFQHKWSSEMFNLFDQPVDEGTPDWDKYLPNIHPDDITEWQMAFKRCKETLKPQTVRFRSLFPDRIIWIEAIGQAVQNTRGQVVKVIGTCQDITTKILFEKQIQEKNLLTLQTSKMATLGEMTATMASEINNPLSIVTSNIDFLKQYKNLDDKIEPKLKALENACDRISKIVSRLTKYTTSKNENLFRVCKLSEFVPDILQFVDGPIKKYNINLMTQFQSDDPIYCNPNDIQQVLLHLLHNSIDAVKDFAHPWIEVKAFSHEGHVIIQVTDSGQGIPYELERKIYEPFYTTKNKDTGRGLGLAISKSIIEAHRGELKINRKLKNTCFEIRLQKEADQQRRLA